MNLKKCLAGISLAIAGSVPVVAGNTYVTIQKNDGTKSSFLLSAVPKITHTADSLKVEGDANASFPLSDVDFFKFTESDLTSVPTLKGDELRVVYLDNQHVRVEGLAAGSQLSLCSVSGAVLSQKQASADGFAEFSLPQAKGVYILKTDKQIVKLVKK